MIPVLDVAGMREADRLTIQELGLPSLVLMEAAADAVTTVVAERFGDSKRIVVAVGPGNNGGDGLAAARQLHCRGFEVVAVLLVEEARLEGDAARQLELARRFGVDVRDASADLAGFSASLAGASLVVDALFGTGLTRPLSGRWAEVVRAINASGVPVVAVDVPSGLSGSLASVPGETVEAAVTVTFGALKVCHVLPPAALRCGEVAVGDIGIPPWVLDSLARCRLLETAEVAGWLAPRSRDAHKGHFGHLLLVAGRHGRAGAAALAARAGVVGGAGLVTVATASGAVTPIQAAVPEAMVDPLPAGADGAVTGEGIEPLLAKATAVAVGPGLGTGDGPRRALETILAAWSGPLLLDADAVTLLAGRVEVLAGREGPTVLTPHPGELARLLGRETAAVAADRLGAAEEAARRGRAVVLAKGAATVVAGPDGPTLVNPTGTPGLASGGAGDVLTGVVGALLAQGVGAREAAAAGAWLHGRAAELAAGRFGGAVPASVVAEHVGLAERELREGA